MTDEIRKLLEMLASPNLIASDIIPWSSPVPAFGRADRSQLATVGINPSNREFVDQSGNELDGAQRRFHTLHSLDLVNWTDASAGDLHKIADSCSQYFEINPYDRWFKRLDIIIAECGYSYYSAHRPACHLDLVPFATWTKWGVLPSSKKRLLLESFKRTLGRMVRDSPVKVLILNGQSVVQQFQMLTPSHLVSADAPGWELSRRGGSTVRGVSYRANVSYIGGVDLRKRVLVLGYNHNIQSSFGVSTMVIDSIGRWLAQELQLK